MSSPGITPQQMQQLQMIQQQQHRAQLAQALQQGMDGQATQQQADPRTPYAGITNAGSSLTNALAYKNAQNAADPLAAVQSTPMFNRYGGLGRLFGFGGV